MTTPPYTALEPTSSLEDLPFSETTKRWFFTHFQAPTAVQVQGWPRIARGAHTLLLAPTGSGKTLAAFFWTIDRLVHRRDLEPGVRTIYVSPLKALVYDVERNLRAPLAGVSRWADRSGEEIAIPEVMIRTGDTPAKERDRQLRKPSEILVTTPESLFLMLGSRQAQNLRTVEMVIIDEIHALAGTKRGAHLALSLERLSRLTGRDPQRIGLSATVRPVEEVSLYLGGDRPVEVVDTLSRPRLDLEIVVPVEDMESPPPSPEPKDPNPSGETLLGQLMREERQQHGEPKSVWNAILPKLLEVILAHRSVIVFVNSRGLSERLADKLNALAEEGELSPAGSPLVLAHHGSVSHEKRRQMEELLKSGQLRAMVATSSLELGIDMGAVDLVVLVESPGSVARGLQRVGRAGHQVGQVSVGKLFPKYRGDLLECAVVARQMLEGALEAVHLPTNPLDILAQQIVAAVSVEELSVAEVGAMMRRAASFRNLSEELLLSVLDMLAGRFPSTEFAELKGRLLWDRDQDRLRPRKGSKMLSLVNAGTIPDRGLYGVYAGPDGPRLGELDEEMVHEMRPGQNFLLGATTWRVLEITRDRVLVNPAPGEPGQMPFWRGEGPGRPVELGQAMGAYLRELERKKTAEALEWLQEHSCLDPLAGQNLWAYLQEQLEFTGFLPTDRTIVVETFQDELGDWRVCLLSPFGSRLHAPWALAIEAQLGEKAGFEVQTMFTDDGIVLRMASSEEPPDPSLLFPAAEDLEDLLLSQLGRSALFAAQFRENAARALLLPRRRPGQRTPLWAQRLKAQNLLAVAREYANFPIVLETYRSCLQDVFDLPSLKELLQKIARGQIKVRHAATPSASPFARSLAFAYQAEYLYQGDQPLAERKAQALTLDRNLLRELLGQESLRELLDLEVLDEVEQELQGCAPERRARSSEGVYDLLRRVGDLSLSELTLRTQAGPEELAQWLKQLQSELRLALMRVGGEERYLAVEDAALYRDALGAVPPNGLPVAFLGFTERPLEQLVIRYARTHSPFSAQTLAARYGLQVSEVQPVLRQLVGRGLLLEGGFRPDGSGVEYCEQEVLRRLRRRTLSRLRRQVAPVSGPEYARFLLAEHGFFGKSSLREILEQLEGITLSFKELEQHLLPSRRPDFRPAQLDELMSSGLFVWVGRGALGKDDGKLALYRRDRLALLAEAPQPPENLEVLEAEILAHLHDKGASFAFDLLQLPSAPTEKKLLRALWELSWRGLVSNDSLTPLRRLANLGKKRQRSLFESAPGRWVAVASLFSAPVAGTQRALAWSNLLLARYGVVSREAAQAEDVPGGFSPLYAVYKELEESGRVRRGYFVEGLSGAQFAWAQTVDRLRHESPDASPKAVLVAATDPANPFGTLLAWPELSGAGKPRRAAGVLLLLVEGEPVLMLEGGGKRLSTFKAVEDPRLRQAGLEGLKEAASRYRGRSLRLQEIAGVSALKHPLAEALRRLGFRDDYRGLTYLAGARTGA